MLQYKRIIYIIIDSFHPRALEHCLAREELPALSFLINNGTLDQDCVSIFPTITPTCISTLATGAPPATHGIPGMVWYHRGERRFVNYGSSWLSMLKNGFIQTAQDFLYNLNHRQLGWQVQTIYESLESRGYYTAAVNPLIYRGNTEYIAHIPFIFKILTLFQLEDTKVYGPKGFCLGRAYQPPGDLRQSVQEMRYWRKLGMNDKFAVRAAKWFLQQEKKPDLLSIYLPDTDSKAHADNPDCCQPCLTRLDKQLASILDCFGNWDKALAENIFIVVGDHAQSTLMPGKQSLVNVPVLLRAYSQARAGEDFLLDRDIAICANERMAYIYSLRSSSGIKKDLVKCLVQEPKLDQIIYKENSRYHVVTERGELSFCQGTNYFDCYGNGWEVTGAWEALDLQIKDQQIQSGDYPNALERIAQCFENPHGGDLVITAKPGYLLLGEGASKWPGRGSHGSLHREDSVVPLIISGATNKIEKPRITDIVPFIKAQLP